MNTNHNVCVTEPRPQFSSIIAVNLLVAFHTLDAYECTNLISIFYVAESAQYTICYNFHFILSNRFSPCFSICPAHMAETSTSAPWHAMYPSPSNKDPESISRADLLQRLQAGQKSGVDFLLVDLRRTDHEVHLKLTTIRSTYP